MLDRKYLQTYKMTFLAFEYLLQELTPFIYPSATQFVRTPYLFRKAVKMVLHRLTHGIFLERTNALYGVNASTIRKYTSIVMFCLMVTNNFQFMFTLLLEIDCLTSLSDFVTHRSVANLWCD